MYIISQQMKTPACFSSHPFLCSICPLLRQRKTAALSGELRNSIAICISSGVRVFVGSPVKSLNSTSMASVTLSMGLRAANTAVSCLASTIPLNPSIISSPWRLLLVPFDDSSLPRARFRCMSRIAAGVDSSLLGVSGVDGICGESIGMGSWLSGFWLLGSWLSGFWVSGTVAGGRRTEAACQ